MEGRGGGLRDGGKERRNGNVGGGGAEREGVEDDGVIVWN